MRKLLAGCDGLLQKETNCRAWREMYSKRTTIFSNNDYLCAGLSDLGRLVGEYDRPCTVNSCSLEVQYPLKSF